MAIRINSHIASLKSQRNLDASQSLLSKTLKRLSSGLRIRDAGIAAETAQLTRAQILFQAGTSVLSQANLSSQSALSLLGQ